MFPTVFYGVKEKKAKGKGKDSVSEELYVSLDCITSKSFSFLIYASILITMFLKNRKVCPKGEWLNKLWPNPMMEAAW